jgi:hypothetical protein
MLASLVVQSAADAPAPLAAWPFGARPPRADLAIIAARLVAEGLDVSARISSILEDATHVAMPLVKAPQLLVAAPAYLERAGTPTTVQELARHNCLVHTLKSPTHHWNCTGPGGDGSIRVSRAPYAPTSAKPRNRRRCRGMRRNLRNRVQILLQHLKEWARLPPGWAAPSEPAAASRPKQRRAGGTAAKHG